MTAFPSITAATFAFGSNEDPITTGFTGSTPTGNTTNLLKSASGVASKNQPSGTGFGAQYTTSAYGPDMEAWCKIVTLTATAGQEILGIMLRVQQEGSAAVDFYYVYALLSAGTDGWTIERVINNSGTSLTSGSRDIAAGDYMGAKVEDSAGNPVISAYWCPAASDPTVSGNWTQVCTTTDPNVAKLTGTGKIAIEVQGIVTTIDDLRAGTIVTGGSDATVTAVVADGVGDSPDPTVQAGSNVTAPVADATGTAPAPANRIDVEIVTGPASGLGDAPVPTVTGATDATVTPPVADATGASPVPSVQAGATPVAPVADATATAPAPTVTGNSAGQVNPPVADAAGAAPAPAIHAGQTIGVPAATAAGDAPIPTRVGAPVEPTPELVPIGATRDLQWVTTGGTTLTFIKAAPTLTFVQADRELVLA